MKLSQLSFLYSLAFNLRTRFTKGGLCYFENLPDASEEERNNFNKNREGFYGWYGHGGSVFQWHPELKIGFAFIPTHLNPLEIANERVAVLQQLVKDCVLNQDGNVENKNDSKIKSNSVAPS